MPEHLFLCGLSDAQRKSFKGGRTLNLHGPQKNIELNIEAMRKRLLGLESEQLTDFLDIASYVFAADRTTGRGSAVFKNMGEAWRRPFKLVIGVRKPEFWSSIPVRAALIEALEFLSEDNWNFEFVDLVNPRPLQQYLQLVEREKYAEGATSILLFSGGLDSLAGAVHELKTTNRHVVLVSHRNVPVMGARQRELAAELKRAEPRRVSHVFVDNHLKGLPDRDETQRTRSIFFAAIATVAAYLESSDRIRFYENGIMSINLPIAGQVVGTKASRSTHPRTLQLLERLVGCVAEQPTGVDNPFIWNTKAEIVRELAKTPHRNLIRRSLSCSRSRGLDSMNPHCGTCAQCLQRRISTLGAGAGEFDPAEGYETDFMLGARKSGEKRAMAVGSLSSAIEFTRLNDFGFISKYAGELSRIQIAFPSAEADAVAKSFISLFRRHGAAVHEIIAEAIRDSADEIAAKTISPDSLLQLVLNSSDGMVPASKEQTGPVVPHLEAATATEVLSPASSELIIALDPAKRWVLVGGGAHLHIAPLHGDAIYPILSLLIEMHREDRENELKTENYRGLLAKQLADQLDLTDETAVRSAISRARSQIIEGFSQLDGRELGDHAVIEHRRNKGYRLNPQVRVVSLAEFKSN